MPTDTILGPIPSEWQYTTLGEVCRLGGGFIQTGPFGSQLHAADYVPVGIPSIMPVNIGDNRIVVDEIARIREADAERLSRHRVQPGDIVYSRRGDVERRALIREAESGWLCGTGCLLVRLGTGVVDPLYASYYLGHPEVKKWVVRHAVGATMPNLNMEIMAAVPFVLPPTSQQMAIARTLGRMDDKIDLNRRMNETLEAMAPTLFKSWFVDFDPVRAKADGRQPPGLDATTAALFPNSFEDSPLGPIPKGWQVTRLADITSKIGSGATPRGGSEVYVDEGIAFIRSQNVYDHSFNWDGLARITDQSAEELQGVTVQQGDVLFNITGDSILRTCVVDPGVLPARVSQHVAIIRPRSDVPSHFVHQYLVRQQMKDYLSGFDTGGTRKAVTKGHLESVPVVLPSRTVLGAFKARTDPLFARVEADVAESRTLTAMRDVLLPKLLSGELQVPNHEPGK
jgi:type I restriction enzyme S subunit